ncbi:phytanoyl-CoA dioxygenase family protein [Haloactinopolyspora sp.]|uniref:phytanoyl-CoA dioxygenase family protein n=1 Tax=Haloactinopolyspora sp. TaxID=1966353 RepID=UPI002620A0D8|nr:phytanoyl-CoA dioxygenase family protein [Haloactinopolyspora sp.]
MNTISSAPAPAGEVDVDRPYELDPATPARFERDGFVRLPGVLTPATIAHFEPEITAKLIELNTMHLPMSERATSQKAFLQVTNLWQHSDLVRRFVLSQKLGRIAAELMGVDGVRLYHDQALYKEPDGGITPWHADQYYWPLNSDRTCTVWVPLQPTPATMGPLEFAVGSQNVDFGRDLPISDESEATVQKALRERDFEVSAEPYDLGDVSYHSGWTFHRAGPNTTQSPRRVMTIIFIDADITVAPPADHQRADLDAFMPGIEPGQVPDTPLNPVIYRR